MELVRAANPKEDEESIQYLTQVLLEMRAMMSKHSLIPCVRTKYTRVALQSPSNNKLRVTIDRDITIINERCVRDNDSSSWCIEDNETIPVNAQVNLPYCIFEVKVVGVDGSPPFVMELEDTGTIIEAKKFSKYLSGASIFNVDKVKTLPWWASDEAFESLFIINTGRGSTAQFGSTSVSTASAHQGKCANEAFDCNKTAEASSYRLVNRELLNENATRSSSMTSSIKLSDESPLSHHDMVGSTTSILKRRKKKKRSIASRTPPRVEPR